MELYLKNFHPVFREILSLSAFPCSQEEKQIARMIRNSFSPFMFVKLNSLFNFFNIYFELDHRGIWGNQQTWHIKH
jgi:hypothetical protein